MDQILLELKHQLLIAWRFRWAGLSVAWIVCLLGWLGIGIQPDKYEATARVFVDMTSDLRNVLGNQIVELDVEDQLRYVREAMLGRVQLENVARETGLAEGLQTEDQMVRFLSGLRRNIQIYSQPIEGQRPFDRPTGASYIIRFVDSNRATAEEVVASILKTFIEYSLGDQEDSSKQSEDFLRAQIKIYEGRLAKAEDELAKFNRDNFDQLPSMQGGYFQRLQEETRALNSARQALRSAQSRLSQIEQQLRGEIPRISVSGEVDPSSVEARILDAENDLNDLLLRYTDNHPDVVATREMLSLLKERKARELNEPNQQNRLEASNNPVYQAARIARNEVEEEIAMIRADIIDREERVETYRGNMDEMPIVEARLAQLNRDYNVINNHYQSLLNSLERENLTQEVFRTEQIDFRVIDPPSADFAPVGPKRAILLLLVLFAGVGSGVGVIYLLGLVYPSFSSRESIQSKLGISCIGSVAKINSEMVQHEKHRSIVSLSLASAALLVTFSLVFLFEVAGPGLRSVI